MKYVASIIFALCFAASMVSCSREDDFEKKEEYFSNSISAVTELNSSSELDFAASSSCAAEPIAEETEISTTTTNIETNSTEDLTSATSTMASRHDKSGQLIETTVEEIVTKPIESTTTVDTTVEIVTKPIESTTTLEGPIVVTGIDEYSYQLLAEIVEHEAGMDSISIYDKAHIASAVMNRVNDSRFPNTVYDNLIDQSQFPGYYPGCIIPRQTAYEAVDYYFAHPDEFDNSNSWFGDGWANYFYYQ